MPPVEDAPRARDLSRPVAGITLAFLTAMATLLTGFAASLAGFSGYSVSRVAFWWLASIALLFATAGWMDARHRPVVSRPAPWRRPDMATMGTWVAMSLVAALPRYIALDRFPTVLDGDEAGFMLQALQFRDGEMANPFTTGYFSSPLGYMVVQGLAADALGEGVWAYRIPSATIGAVGVLAVWRLGTRLYGELAGALAGLLLAMMPLHLHFSRNGLNNVTDPTFLALALLFGLRSLEGRRALDGLLSGISLGLALYGYYGGRALWVVVLVSLLAVAVLQRTSPRAFLRAAGWIVAGFAGVALPLAVAFQRNPAEFGGHLAQVSSITLERFRHDPAGTGQVYLQNFGDAFVYPLWGDPSGFFRHARPFIGWELAILVVAGLGVMLVNAIRRRHLDRLAVIFLPYALLVAGIALAIPPASQRYVSVTPLLAITAGAGLATAARVAARLMPSRRHVARVVVTLAVVMAIGVANLRWSASEDRQLDTYGGPRSTMMWDLGWRLNEGDGSISRLLLAGAPFVFAYGFPNLTVLAPDVIQEDLQGQFFAGGGAPALPADAILVLVPERMGERCAIERAYPDATGAEARSRDGSVLYIVFFPGGMTGLSAAETPAGSTLDVVADSPCASG